MRKSIVVLLLFCSLATYSQTQQYDDESDFRTANENGGAVILEYLGSKQEVRIPPRIQNLPVTSIWHYSFSECTSLTSVIIPDSVTTIGNDAFHHCASLTSITIPNGVTSIGDNAFYFCTNLTSVTIPNSVTAIKVGAFSGCTSLTSVTVPDSVTTIEIAFLYCTSLTAINVSAGNSVYSSQDGVLYNKNKTLLHTYPEGKKFKSFTIPNSVTSIEWNAFSGCTGLTSITIPNSVTRIGGWAFGDCTSLTSVTFQGTIASNQFDDYAFYKLGDLRDKFYAANRTNGTPGTYTRASGESETWTRR